MNGFELTALKHVLATAGLRTRVVVSNFDFGDGERDFEEDATRGERKIWRARVCVFRPPHDRQRQN